MCVLRQFAALCAMVTMGTAPIKVLHYYYYDYYLQSDAQRSPELRFLEEVGDFGRHGGDQASATGCCLLVCVGK